MSHLARAGTRNPNAKLTEDKVRAIRRRKTEPDRPNNRVLAAEFDVNESTIRAVLSGERWGWLD